MTQQQYDDAVAIQSQLDEVGKIENALADVGSKLVIGITDAANQNRIVLTDISTAQQVAIRNNVEAFYNALKQQLDVDFGNL